jgi:hypothetical protein
LVAPLMFCLDRYAPQTTADLGKSISPVQRPRSTSALSSCHRSTKPAQIFDESSICPPPCPVTSPLISIAVFVVDPSTAIAPLLQATPESASAVPSPTGRFPVLTAGAVVPSRACVTLNRETSIASISTRCHADQAAHSMRRDGAPRTHHPLHRRRSRHRAGNRSATLKRRVQRSHARGDRT